jgi:hypothetical protein
MGFSSSETISYWNVGKMVLNPMNQECYVWLLPVPTLSFMKSKPNT